MIASPHSHLVHRVMMNILRAVPPIVIGLGGAASGQFSFSIDFQGPTIGAPDSFSNIPITEADILVAPWPFVPMPGPGFKPATAVWGGVGVGGANLGLPGWFAVLGHPPGVPGLVEVDALSYGTDFMIDTNDPVPPLWTFSVDEFAWGGPASPAPSVFTEGMIGWAEASADVFVDGGVGPDPIGPGPPGTFANVAIFDGDGFAPFGGPGYGLVEPNWPSPPPHMPDMGDNLDALDVDEPIAPGFAPYPIYFSLDCPFPDPFEFPAANTGSAAAIGNAYAGGDVLVTTVSGAIPVVYAQAQQLGLDLVAGPETDDLDALVLHENGDGVYQPSQQPFDWLTGATDMLLFSVRRGSSVIGKLDSLTGSAIEEGDILCPPVAGGVSPYPGIFIAAEMLNLGTVRFGMLGPTLFADDLDALDLAEDCNGTRSPDWYDIATGVSLDTNANGVPDECETSAPVDINADGVVDVQDLLLLLAAWGSVGGPADVNGDGIVDVQDLLLLLAAW